MIFQALEKLLKKISSFRISFEDGSYIEYYHGQAILYCDADHQRKMEILWSFHPKYASGKILRRSDINHWAPPNEAQLLTPEQKTSIEKKIVEYCRRKKMHLEIVD